MIFFHLYKTHNLFFIIDDDECASPDLNDCVPNSACNNFKGSYNCTCWPGYYGDGKVSCEGITFY